MVQRNPYVVELKVTMATSMAEVVRRVELLAVADRDDTVSLTA